MRILNALLVWLCVIPVYYTSSSASAEECSCPPKPDIKTALESASLVFIGQVSKVGRNAMKPKEVEVKLTAYRKFKGFEDLPTDDKPVILYTTDPSGCGYEFHPGLDYLIYANGTPAHFIVDRCTRTEMLDNAGSEVRQLSALTRVGFVPTSTTTTTVTSTTRHKFRRFELR
jgi:hypothetical protein